MAVQHTCDELEAQATAALAGVSILSVHCSPRRCRQAVADKLHTLWTDFAVRLVRKGAAKGELAEVVRRHLDFHGCKLKVVEAANPMHVGIVGVCVENSRTSVHLAARWLNAGPHAGPGLKLSTVPKRGSRFEFAFPTGASTHRTVTLLGDLIKGRTVTS